jgi:hypothetical protein
MAKTCYCGCGMEIPFGRRRIANKAAAQYARDLSLCKGLLERDPDHANDAELQAIVAEGDRWMPEVRQVVHGEVDRKDVDREAIHSWWKRAFEYRKATTKDVIDTDYAGWDAHEQADLLYAGARAPGQVVAIGDTGASINDLPRIELTIRVAPPGEAPFDVTRKVTVSRVELPRVGEHVEVAYDPADRARFTFRMGDLTDDPMIAPALVAVPAVDPVERLERLVKLRDAGALTPEEFEREKQKVLGVDFGSPRSSSS